MSTEAATRDRHAVVAWALMALSAVGSAWCAYQASLWKGHETRSLARAGVAQFEAARKEMTANRKATVDVATFLDYVGADLRGDTRAATFVREHARAGFKPALEAWIADKKAGDARLDNPLVRPQYQIEEAAEGLALAAAAAAAVSDANNAGTRAELYVLHTVFFALALLFLGATSQAWQRWTRTASLVFGAFIFVLTVASLARQPREGVPRPEHNPSVAMESK
jgi:hypothetical protein